MGASGPRSRSPTTGFHVAVTWWSERVEQQMAECVDRGVNSFKHFMAYKGALMVDDETLFKSFTRCRELGRLADGACRERRCRLPPPAAASEPGHHRPRGPRPVAAAACRGRGRQPGDHDRPDRRRAALHRHTLLQARRTRRSPARAPPGSASMASLWRSISWSTRASTSTRTGSTRRPGDEPAVPLQGAPEDRCWDGLVSGSLQVMATDHCAFLVEQKKMGLDNFTRIPNGTGGIEERMKVVWMSA